MAVEIKELLNVLVQKTGVEIPEEMLTAINSIEGDIEDDGTILGAFENLINPNDVISGNLTSAQNKKVHDAVKARVLAGFEENVLDKELASLTPQQQAEYKGKKTANEKFKYLAKALKGNGSNTAEMYDLQQKIEEYNDKIEKGQLVEASQVSEWQSKYNGLQQKHFTTSFSSKLKTRPLVESFTNDPNFEDIVNLKAQSLFSELGITKDYETGFYKKGDDIAKHPQKPSKPLTDDDVIEMFIQKNQNLVKRSEPPKEKVEQRFNVDENKNKSAGAWEEEMRAKARLQAGL